MFLKPGTYRSDILILLTYQLCQFYSTQQLYPILLNYVPPVKCEDDYCFKVAHKCYEQCTDCPEVCYNGTDLEKQACVADNQPYFFSAAMEYKPFCLDGYRAFSSTTIQYIGVLLGNCFAGVLADRYGRRLILLLALAFGIPDLALSAVFVSLPVFYLFRFLVGISIAATMTVGWAYCAEMISAKHRFKLRTFTSWTNSRLLMTALTHLAHTWRLATYYHAILSLGAVSMVYMLPESPLWLKSKGQFEKEEQARKLLAHINGLKYKPDVEPRTQSAQSHLTLLDVYKNPELRTNFLVLCVMWFCAALSMYMIDLNGEDMTKNFWLGQYLSGALASIIRIIVGLADSYLPWLGRRKVYIISMSICILASIGLTVQLYAGEKGSTFYFVTYLTAYNSISVAWEPNFLGAAELMPTDVRAKSTALLNIISRLASVLASQMIYFKTIYEPAIMIVLIISNVFSFVVATTWLKETKNINLERVGGEKSKDVTLEQANDSSKSAVRSRKVGELADQHRRMSTNDGSVENEKATH